MSVTCRSFRNFTINLKVPRSINDKSGNLLQTIISVSKYSGTQQNIISISIYPSVNKVFHLHYILLHNLTEIV